MVDEEIKIASDTTGLTLLGQSGAPSQKKLESFPSPPHMSMVEFKVDEFTSLCPMTGQPDFATIDIQFNPQALCLEAKSLKLYLQTFRNEGAFAEALAAQIASDIFNAIKPEWIQVRLHQAKRGGIAEIATAYIHSNP